MKLLWIYLYFIIFIITVKRISILLNNIVLHSLHSHNIPKYNNNQTQTIPLIFVYFVDELHQNDY